MCVITSTDITKAHNKWYGRDRANGISWRHSDHEFYEHLSAGCRIDRGFLLAFASSNMDSKPARRSGGYSILRRHWGGAELWANKLNSFFASKAFQETLEGVCATRDPQQTIYIVDRLANITGTGQKGTESPLGISAASKWLFFRAPELPIFIYDSVARHCLFGRTPVTNYNDWWVRCAC